jgi:hypothetical protein
MWPCPNKTLKGSVQPDLNGPKRGLGKVFLRGKSVHSSFGTADASKLRRHMGTTIKFRSQILRPIEHSVTTDLRDKAKFLVRFPFLRV